MSSVLLWFIAIVMGMITSVYLPMNGALAKHLGSAALANIPFYLLGTVTTLGLFFGTSDLATVNRLPTAPSYLYVSGVLSAVLILGSTLLIPRLGASRFFSLFVAGQLVMALVVSHLGWLASPQDPITLKKGLGVLALIIGVVLATP